MIEHGNPSDRPVIRESDVADPMRKNQVVGRAAVLGAAAGAVALGLVATGRRTAAAGVVAGAGALGVAAFVPTAPLFGPTLSRGTSAAVQAALTFDDGPGPSTGDLLDVLAHERVRATFFVLGRQVRAYPELIARMQRDGHQIASHGYDHGILVFRGPRYVDHQLRATEVAVLAAAGPGALTPYFRAPHGFRGPATWLSARRRGYRMAAWTTGVWDTAEPGVETIVARSAKALVPGAVILLHDADGWDATRARPQTVDAIPGICAAARDRGLALVRFDELVGV
jgi:peptidoglycan/xylan/chitin deacetylase (PgdA/CDA1 family)